MKDLQRKLNEAVTYIKSVAGEVPIDIAIVLGSGLGGLADKIENPIYILTKKYHPSPFQRSQDIRGVL